MKKVEILLHGQLDQEWAEWLHECTITYPEPNQTCLTGFVEDQAALYGLMSKLRDLGLQLISVQILPTHPGTG